MLFFLIIIIINAVNANAKAVNAKRKCASCHKNKTKEFSNYT